jgi:hypothetical protein
MTNFRSSLPDEIIERAEVLFSPNARGSYELSYPIFTKFFEDRSDISEQDFILGANFTYAWMPTILNFKSLEISMATSLANKVKNGIVISNEELMLIKSVVNNSLVGTSKLLHFINPNDYAIWDSRVLHFLSGKSYKYNLEKPQLYSLYLQVCKQVSRHPKIPELLERYTKEVGYQVTPLRLVELIMFHGSGNWLGKSWLK